MRLSYMIISFNYPKLVDGLLRVHLAGVENDGREVGMVGRIGEMLALQTDGRAARERSSALPLVAVRPVVGVELHARLGGIDGHGAPAVRLFDTRSQCQFARLMLVEHEAMVVTRAVPQLLIIVVDVPPDGFRRAEVERRALYLANLACGNGGLVNGKVIVGVQFAHHIVDDGGGIGDACQ